MNKKITKIAVLGMALAMIMTSSLAFAETKYGSGTEAEPASLYFNKLIETPSGTSTPNASFSYTITGLTVDGEEDEMPELSASITMTSPSSSEKDGIKTVSKLGEIDLDKEWPHAGEYVYEISENKDTYNCSSNETLSYDTNKYQLTVNVANGENDGDLFVQFVSAQKLGESGPEGDKLDLSNGSSNQLSFTSKYTKKATVTPSSSDDDNDNCLMIKKTVSGNMGDKTEYFKFKVTLTKSSLVSATSCKAKIIGSDGQVVENMNLGNEVDFDKNGKVTIPYGTPFEFKIKHGERLVLCDAYYGTAFDVEEIGAEDEGYDVSKTVIAGGKTISKAEDPQFISDEGANSVLVNNALELASPTGFMIDNLPFVILIMLVMALIGINLFIRKRTDEE